jgi:hypothetical protein
MTEWEYKPKPKPEEPEMVDPKGMVMELFTRMRKKKPDPEKPLQSPKNPPAK